MIILNEIFEIGLKFYLSVAEVVFDGFIQRFVVFDFDCEHFSFGLIHWRFFVFCFF